MVMFYSFLIEPGHPREFYTEAALWIAPWSSHLLGPLVFGISNYMMARRVPQRPALAFVCLTLVMYVVIEVLTLAGMDSGLAAMANPIFLLSLTGKLTGALAGA